MCAGRTIKRTWTEPSTDGVTLNNLRSLSEPGAPHGRLCVAAARICGVPSRHLTPRGLTYTREASGREVSGTENSKFRSALIDAVRAES